MGTPEDYEGRSHRKSSTAVTSHDVALAAGVSQATVACTFSSPDLVAPETKIRVLEAAERLTYIPNSGGMKALAEYLVATGHRSVVFVGGVEAAPTDQLRYQGAVRTFGDHGVSCRYIEAGVYTHEAELHAAAHIIEERRLPDAVMDTYCRDADEAAETAKTLVGKCRDLTSEQV